MDFIGCLKTSLRSSRLRFDGVRVINGLSQIQTGLSLLTDCSCKFPSSVYYSEVLCKNNVVYRFKTIWLYYFSKYNLKFSFCGVVTASE
jgi:hypothetical protein